MVVDLSFDGSAGFGFDDFFSTSSTSERGFFMRLSFSSLLRFRPCCAVLSGILMTELWSPVFFPSILRRITLAEDVVLLTLFIRTPRRNNCRGQNLGAPIRSSEIAEGFIALLAGTPASCPICGAGARLCALLVNDHLCIHFLTRVRACTSSVTVAVCFAFATAIMSLPASRSTYGR